MKARIAGLVIVGVFGAFVGARFGLASAGGASNGWFAFGTLGAIIGFFATPDAVKVWERPKGMFR